MAAPGAKRKREGDHQCGVVPDHRPPKQVKTNHLQCADVVRHALLAEYYQKVQTLRQYVLSKLPATSRIRRKKIASLGLKNCPYSGPTSEVVFTVGRFLDTTFISLPEGPAASASADGRWEQWLNYSQNGDESYVTLQDGVGKAYYSQPEIVEFVVWLLFERERKAKKSIGTKPDIWPRHLLCDGFRTAPRAQGRGQAPVLSSIPGLFSAYPNPRVQTLKESPWPQLLSLLGTAGQRIMIDLLLDCSIFIAVDAGRGNLLQLSGKPVSELDMHHSKMANEIDARSQTEPTTPIHTPTNIVFVRSRMLYARAALNAKGLVHFGFRHIHVLNRFPYKPQSSGAEGDQPDESQTLKSDENERSLVRIMMYIFPRQFGLHNVFTSKVDRAKTAQKFQDYTLREDEIMEKYGRPDVSGDPNPQIPKRLRGELKYLIQRLQILHTRCSYSEMLQHYCPPGELERASASRNAASISSLLEKNHSKQNNSRRKSRQSLNMEPPKGFASLTELATPVANVSAFCQAVLTKVIPKGLWGSGESGKHNRRVFLRNVDHFIRLRRFESMSLHDVLQGLKIMDIKWLTPPKSKNQKPSQTDTRKRMEIFSEFLYYSIDSLLIPLIRSNFYVTESSIHRYRLFFFRHDIWRYVAEPAMASLKVQMFEEVKLDDALRILDSRNLGFSQVRLLPKGAAMRPIMNLRRRSIKRGYGMVLGPSINAILAPVHTMLNLEKILRPERLSSTMFSVGDMYTRVKAFKAGLDTEDQKFYFAKVDVQAAFDTIPQDAIVRLMNSIPTQDQYRILKYAEVRPDTSGPGSLSGGKMTRRWHSIAKTATDSSSFLQLVEQRCAATRKNTVFVDSVIQKIYGTPVLMSLLESHIQQNLVKVGKKYYRQKDGIPQGSVLSSILCNYFYADLELQRLPFLRADDCLLLRLIDDFLLITTSKTKACKFVDVMQEGLPDYGVVVHPGKTLVNFELTRNGTAVPRVQDEQGFPYCGTLLDCKTLNITKDREKTKDSVIYNSLTVEYSRLPGKNFKRKVLNAFRIQSHLMFFDTSHNSRRTMLENLYLAFVETATKMWAYARCLPGEKQPSPRLLIDTIRDLISLAFVLLTSRSRRTRYPGYRCSVTQTQVTWLAIQAFRAVLTRRQARYTEVLAWLDAEVRKLQDAKEVREGAVMHISAN